MSAASAVGAVKDAVVKIGSVMEENKGVVTAVGGTGKTGVRAEQAVEASAEATGVYRSVKSGLSWARAGAAALSTIPAVGEVLGTVPQIVITGAELVTDVAGGQKSDVVMKNLTANAAQVAADAIPGGGLAMLAVRGGLSVAGDKIRGGETVASSGGMPKEADTPPKKLAAAKTTNQVS